MTATTTTTAPVIDGIDYPDPPKNSLEAAWWAFTATTKHPELGPKGIKVFQTSQERYDARYGYGAWGRDYKLIQQGINYVLAYDLDPDWDETGPSIPVEEMEARYAETPRPRHTPDEDPFWVDVVAATPPMPKDKNLMGLYNGLSRPIAKTIWDQATGTTIDPLVDLGARYLSDIPADPPPPLLVGRLHPTKHTILFGEGGVGKGTLTAWWVVQLVRLGYRVLILDYENNPDEWSSRINSLGGDELMDRIVHASPNSETWKGNHGAFWDSKEDIKALADAVGATFLVVDSLVAATGGADAGSGNTEAPAKYAAALTHIGRPCLSLAHVNKANDLKYPFGSVFWHSFARLTWSLKWSENRQSTILENRKHNNYTKQPATDITVTLRHELPVDVFEKPRSIVLADLVWDVLTEPMTVKEVTAALDANLDDGEPRYNPESIAKTLRRGIEAKARVPQRFRLTGDQWSRYEG